MRNRRRFVFGPDFLPRLLTVETPEGEALPERKFWVLATGADNDDEPGYCTKGEFLVVWT